MAKLNIIKEKTRKGLCSWLKIQKYVSCLKQKSRLNCQRWQRNLTF